MSEEGNDVNQASSLRVCSLLYLFGDVKEKLLNRGALMRNVIARCE